MKKRADGRYVETVTIDGKRKYVYGHSKEEVREKLEALKKPAECSVLFSDIAYQWQESYFKLIRYNTQQCYLPAFKRAVERFGDETVTEITAPAVMQWMLYLKSLNYSSQTIKVHKQVLSLIMDEAVYRMLLPENPCKYVKRVSGRPAERRETASDKDIAIIKESADVPFGLFPIFLLYTGCRRNEALAVHWEDINFNVGLITISKQVEWVNNAAVISETKTEAGRRVVPLLEPLREILEPLRQPTGAIFHQVKDESKLMTQSSFRKAWEHYISITHIETTPHELRHTYATILFENNVNEKDAQNLLGHTSIKITQDIYTHIRDKHRAELFAKLIEKVQ